MKLSTRPYDLLLLTALLLIIISIIMGKRIVDFHLHDTYYVLSTPIFFTPFALFLSTFWLFYQFTARWMYSKALAWIHIAATLSCVLLISILTMFVGFVDLSLNFSRSFIRFNQFNFILSLVVLIMAAVQILCFINLILGLLLPKQKMWPI
jgi:hypothetical protein